MASKSKKPPSKPPSKPSKPAPKSKNGAKPPKSTPKTDTNTRSVDVGGMRGARKVGERKETVTELLSPMQVEEESRAAVRILREVDKAEEDRKNAAATHRAKLSDLRTRLADHARAASTAKRDREVTIEEWLTEKNEVIRVRSDTRERIGNRAARADDLQEPLPLPEPVDEEEAEDEDEPEEDLEVDGDVEGFDEPEDDADEPAPTGDPVIDDLRRRRDERAKEKQTTEGSEEPEFGA